MVRVTENRLEPKENERGLINYLWDKQSDLLLYAVIPSSWRYKVIDLTWPYLFDALSFLIPVPDEDAANIYAAIKPFQWPVWLSLVISTICVIFVLNQLMWYKESTKEKTDNSTMPLKRKHKLRHKTSKGNLYLFVFGNLLSQGGHFKKNQLAFRLIIGVWVIAAFILVQAYTSTLFTYVIAPITTPLINSAEDIAKNKDINLLHKRGGSIETVIRSSNKTTFRELQARIDAFPNSRCNLPSECIKMITPGSKNIYLDGKPFQLEAIAENFRRTGKCNFQLARDDFVSVYVSFALPKGSLYTNSVNRGLLEIQETGLYKYWDLWLPPTSHHCVSDRKEGYIKSSNRKLKPALTLKNLIGAFIALFVGIGLSLLAFVYEKVSSVVDSLSCCSPKK